MQFLHKPQVCAAESVVRPPAVAPPYNCIACICADESSLFNSISEGTFVCFIVTNSVGMCSFSKLQSVLGLNISSFNVSCILQISCRLSGSLLLQNPIDGIPVSFLLIQLQTLTELL
jgi:hypothetical protein